MALRELFAAQTIRFEKIHEIFIHYKIDKKSFTFMF